MLQVVDLVIPPDLRYQALWIPYTPWMEPTDGHGNGHGGFLTGKKGGQMGDGTMKP